MDLGRRFGVKGYRVDRPEAIRQAITADRLALVDVLVDADEEVSPWELLVRMS